jgi:haloalkane dehalogenase
VVGHRVVRAGYPFDSHFLSLDDGRLHYVARGPEGGRAVLLLHGNPTWSYLYRRLIPGLAAVGFRVHALDLPGFGLSDPLPPLGSPFGHHAAAVRGFVEVLGLADVVLVGHEWGGPAGLRYAADAPDNVAAHVWLNTSLMVGGRLPRWYRLLRAPFVGETLVVRRNLYVERLLPLGVVHRAELTDVVRDAYREPFRTPARRTAILAVMRQAPAHAGQALWDDLAALAEDVGAVEAPGLVIASREDRLFGPAAGRRLAAQLPHAELAVFHGAGHYLQEDIPQKLVAAISRFLDEAGIR